MLSKILTTLLLMTVSLLAKSQNFVQVNSAVPQSAGSVSVSYTKAQTAGDLNVVIVGWNDTSSSVSSVTDSLGNVYQLAVPVKRAGPSGCISSGLSQAIYYASNIKAGSNTVKVVFNQTACAPDIRIAEYTGGWTFDVGASGSGSSSSASSGTAVTTASDIIVGGNMVWTVTSGAGSGYTKRIITNPDGDILEDRTGLAGTYSATAPLGSSGNWVMQMATFKPNATTPPPPPPNVTIALYPGIASGGQIQMEAPVSGTTNTAVTWTATAGSVSSTGLYTAPSVTSSTVVTITATSQADATKSASTSLIVDPTITTQSHTVVLTWNASTSSNVGSYNVYRSTVSGGPYSKIGNSGTVLDFTDSSVQNGTTYFYVATAVDATTGAESTYSNEAMAVIP